MGRAVEDRARRAGTGARRRWNGDEGALWAAERERFDRMLGPPGEALLAAAGPVAGEWVLDAGCGAGALVLEAARCVGPSGRAVGLDVSALLLDVARRRTVAAGLPVELVVADAGAPPFRAGVFDVVISRFAANLLPDPAAALGRLARALRTGGRLALACWRDPAANDWSALPREAVAAVLGLASIPEPDEPAAFAFAEAGHVEEVLDAAGFEHVRLEPHEERLWVGDGVGDAAGFFAAAAGAGLRGAVPPVVLGEILATLSDRLAGFAGPGGVRLPSSWWIVTASRARGPVGPGRSPERG